MKVVITDKSIIHIEIDIDIENTGHKIQVSKEKNLKCKHNRKINMFKKALAFPEMDMDWRYHQLKIDESDKTNNTLL